MIKINVELENITTDEEAVTLQLPLNENELHSLLMRNCDYLIVECDNLSIFDEYDDVFDLNKTINRICSENPSITNNALLIISDVIRDGYYDKNEIIDKICENDFMYEKLVVPQEWHRSIESYAAFVLFSEYGVPFSQIESEMTKAKKAGKDYGDWDSVWDVYSFMGFHICEDIDDVDVTYIVNLEDSEQ